jgi:hypothetical protein
MMITTATGSFALLVGFIYSSEVAYVIEFSDGKARFFYDGDVLEEDGTEVVIDTDYAEADLPYLQFRQVGDVMWITHPSYPPAKLTRTTAYDFSIDDVEFTGGPFMTRNDLIDPDVSTTAFMLYTGDVAVGSTGTLTCQDDDDTGIDYFEAGHIGALFKLTHKRTNTVSTGTIADGTGTGTLCAAIDVEGDFSFTMHGTWTGITELQRNENGAGWEVVKIFDSADDLTPQVSKTETEYNVQYQAVVTSHTSGEIKADITVNNSIFEGIVRVTEITSPPVDTVTVEVVRKLDPTEGTEPTRRWAEGVWSGVRGYPSSCDFYKGRCIYGGMVSIPAQVVYT